MENLTQILAVDARYAIANFSAGGPYGAPSLAGALLFALGLLAWRRRARGRRSHLRLLSRALFPRRIVGHPSSRVDLRLFTLNVFVFGAAYAWLAIGGLRVRDATLAALTQALSEHPPTPWPWPLVMGLTTLAALLAYELAYWFAHYLFHRFEFLWEFHKVHHSAEVMTTLTELRQHPVEILVFVNLIALSTGATLGALTYAFGPGARAFTLLDANAALMLFLITWGHLRHSHVWLSFGGLAGRLLQSPAHHQIHHSTNPAHYNKNLGFALAVWDWLFGTLYVPADAPERVAFGVAEARGDYDTALRSLARPFARAAGRLVLRGAAQAAKAPEA